MFQLVVVDADGSHPTTLQHPPIGCNCLFTWSPDGTKVTAYQDGATYDTGSLMLVDSSGTRPPESIPFQGGTSSSGVSWQRLAP